MSDQEIFRQRGAYLVPDVAPTLDASYGDKWTGDQYCFRDGFFVYENHAQDSRVREMGDVCSTVSAKYGTGGGNCIPGFTRTIHELQPPTDAFLICLHD